MADCLMTTDLTTGNAQPVGVIQSDASDIEYDNITSELSATDVQSAIDEVNGSLAAVATSGDYRDLSHKIEVTRWMGNGTETGTANQWSHISGGTIPASAIPAGFELYNLVSLYATSMNTSGWSRVIANVRALNTDEIAVSIYSTIALPVNQIQFRAIWTKND